jgi:hypothetical protein
MHTINDSDVNVGIMLAPPATMKENPMWELRLLTTPVIMDTLIWFAETFFILDF